MTIFNLTKQYFSIIGIDINRSNQVHPFNIRNVTSILISILCLILNCIFTFYGANDMIERIYSVEYGSQYIFCGFIFLLNIKATAKMYQFINCIETIIVRRKRICNLFYPPYLWTEIFFTGTKNSKSKAIYDESNQQIELWSKRIYNFIIPLTISTGIATFMSSIFDYFTLENIENDTMKFVFPMW